MKLASPSKKDQDRDWERERGKKDVRLISWEQLVSVSVSVSVQRVACCVLRAACLPIDRRIGQ